MNASEIEVGITGATMGCGSDRYAGTVVEVRFNDAKVPNFIAVREDHAKRVDSNGISESQAYEYTPDENGRMWYFKTNRKGEWRTAYYNEETGRYNIPEGARGGVHIGSRRKHIDPHR